MKLDINNFLPDGVQLTTGNPESVNLDSDKTHVIVRYAVKQIDDPHAKLKQQYALDVETCATIDGLEPWELWQCESVTHGFVTCVFKPKFYPDMEYRRHPHADSMIEFHKCSDANKKRWQFRLAGTNGNWAYAKEPTWQEKVEYRLKPRTISVTLQNGQVLEFPEPVREPLEDGDIFWFKPFSMKISSDFWHNTKGDLQLLADNRVFLTQDDCQAAQDTIQTILSQRSE